MREQPLVTVLIPVYNRPAVLKTIQSIIQQTYSNLEILIVDNASTDSTVNDIKNIVDERIRLLVNEENRGQTFSLNRGLKEAKGKYIARIDSDDIALPERIEKQVEFLEKHPDYVLVGSWVRFISDNDELGMIVKMPTTDKGLRLMHTVVCGMYHPSAMYRREIIVDHELYYDPDIHMAEDYDLWVCLMQYGKACNLGEPLVLYRRGNNNDSRHHHDLMGKESTVIRRKVCSELRIQAGEKKRIFDEIALEEKENKGIIDCQKVFSFYKRYLYNNLEKSSPDYEILNQHFTIKTYGACIASNDKLFARLLRKVYLFLREKKK